MKTAVTVLLSITTWGVMAGQETAAKLPAEPRGPGQPAANREWWSRLAMAPEAAEARKRAGTWLATPMPAFEPERYLDYVTNGDRERYQKINSRRWDRFEALVLGECLEGTGRFYRAIDETARSLCADPSWILPAHDGGARVFKGADPYVDLGVAMNGYQMALACWLLDGRLPAETIALMRANVYRRLINPVLGTIDGTAPKSVISGNWWARANHNWNAVCTAGAVGAILALEPSVETRAKAVDWAMGNMKVFLSGFARDGYCSEGVGYWNYGFSHFTALAEMLCDQTGGAVDLLRAGAVPQIAAAPTRLHIVAGLYPAFADCPLNARPDPRLVELLRWRLSKRPFSGSPTAELAGSTLLYMRLMHLAAREGAPVVKTPREEGLGLRSWFPDSGLCVVRPVQPGGLAAAWKGGHNAEHHNHNDIGTTVVVWKGRQVLTDPGAMVYRAETFSRDRYRLPVMGSFGHSVPVPAGRLQAEGGKSRGVVTATEFTDGRDSVTIDLTSAYPDAGLEKLERQWTYHRGGSGSLVVEDRYTFAKPSSFATALVGFGAWHLVRARDSVARFLIDGGNGAVVQVDAEFSGRAAWDVRNLPNPGKPTATRLGLSLTDPAAAGFIRMTIRPAVDGIPPDASRLPVGSIAEKLADPRAVPKA